MQSNEIDVIYKQYCNLVLSTAYAWVRNREAAQDICQEVFVKLYMRADKIDIDKVKGWLLVVTEHEAVSYIRTKGKVTTLSMSDQDVEEEIDEIAANDSPEKNFERCELKSRIFRELYQRSEAWYEIIVRLFVYKEEPRHVAKSLDMSYAHMRTTLNRARVWIRETYGSEYEEIK